ncbi:MAG TPA: Hsp20/alpha crystallin family protein [Planctomycetota bacterium]|nr:Hsp20/alpha crystallin family protein [Planctomycetota bacterium]
MKLIPARSRRRGGEITRGAGTAGPPWARLRSEMDRLFERFFQEPWAALAETFGPGRAWMPSVDVLDSEKEVTVRAEVPGLGPEDVEVTLSGATLLLRGEKKEEREERGRAYYRAERRYGAFRRAIPLPPGVDPATVSAEYDKGVLTVRIAKSEQARPRRIEVVPRA